MLTAGVHAVAEGQACLLQFDKFLWFELCFLKN